MKPKQLFTTILRIIISAILCFQAFQKLLGNEEMISLFKLLNLEPFGRIIWSLLELLIAILLLIPRIHFMAMLLNFFMISLIILSHFLLIGVMMDESKGYLMVLSMTVLFANFIYLYLNEAKVEKFFKGLQKGKLILFLRTKPKRKISQEKTPTD